MQLHQISAFALQRLTAQNHVQLFANNALCQRLSHLVCGQVGQQVGHVEDGIGILFTDADGHNRAVGTVYHTVNGQRNGSPLVLLDAAVIVGLKVGNFGILVQRIRL